MPDINLPRGKQVTLTNGIFTSFRLHPEYDVRNARDVLDGLRAKARTGNRDDLSAVLAWLFADDPKIWTHEPSDTDEQKTYKDARKAEVDKGRQIVEDFGKLGRPAKRRARGGYNPLYAQGYDALKYIKVAYEKTSEASHNRSPNPDLAADDTKGDPSKWPIRDQKELQGVLDGDTPEGVWEDAAMEYRRDYSELYEKDPKDFGPFAYLRMAWQGGFSLTPYERDPDYDGHFRYDFEHSNHYRKFPDGYPIDPRTINAMRMDEAMDVSGSAMYRETPARKIARMRVKLQEGATEGDAAKPPDSFSLGTAKPWRDRMMNALGRNDASGNVNPQVAAQNAEAAKDIAYYALIMHYSNETPLPERIRARDIQLGELNDAFATRVVLPYPNFRLLPFRDKTAPGKPWRWQPVRFSFFRPPRDGVWSLSNGKASGGKWGTFFGALLMAPIALNVFPEMFGWLMLASPFAGASGGANMGERVFDALIQYGYRTREFDKKGFRNSIVAGVVGGLIDVGLLTYAHGVPFKYLLPWIVAIPTATTLVTVAKQMGVTGKKFIMYAAAATVGYSVVTDAATGIRSAFTSTPVNDTATPGAPSAPGSPSSAPPADNGLYDQLRRGQLGQPPAATPAPAPSPSPAPGNSLYDQLRRGELGQPPAATPAPAPAPSPAPGNSLYDQLRRGELGQPPAATPAPTPAPAPGNSLYDQLRRGQLGQPSAPTPAPAPSPSPAPAPDNSLYDQLRRGQLGQPSEATPAPTPAPAPDNSLYDQLFKGPQRSSALSPFDASKSEVLSRNDRIELQPLRLANGTVVQIIDGRHAFALKVA